MSNLKNLFLNPMLKTGGFYELAIQVCPSIDNIPIKDYTDFIWNKINVEGPFDVNFNLISVDIDNIEHNGILTLGDYKIPFKTYNIREAEPTETGYNWFDICFYTSAIEHVFGKEFQTWTESPKVPIELNKFLEQTALELHDIFHFQLALKDFEISGQYYLKDLSETLQAPFRPQFIIGKTNAAIVKESNKPFVTLVEELKEKKYA
jgi:hypothetical protein